MFFALSNIDLGMFPRSGMETAARRVYSNSSFSKAAVESEYRFESVMVMIPAPLFVARECLASGSVQI